MSTVANLHTDMAIRALSTLSLLLLLVVNGCRSDTTAPGADSDQQAPLYLSPMLSNGHVTRARQLARVTDLPGSDVESYAGYITVDEPDCGSNLFFWFFPAQESCEHAPLILWLNGCTVCPIGECEHAPLILWLNGCTVCPIGEESCEHAPLILWLNGGPYRSSMYGAIIQHGPLQLMGTEGAEYVIPRNVTWTQHFSMLYVDNPVGAGASFSSGGCYPQNMDDISWNLYSFLQQFFVMFAEYAEIDFYIGGQSYAGKYVPSLGYYIYTRNHDDPENYIRLRGIFIGGGFCDPETMLPELPEFMYGVGTITDIQRRRQKEAIAEGWSKPDHNPFYPENKTHYEYLKYYMTIPNCYACTDNWDDLRKTDREYSRSDVAVENFLKRQHVARALHIDLSQYVGFYQLDNVDRLGDEFMKGVKQEMSFLMDRYKVLYYTGNMDIVVNVRMGEAFLLSTPWSGQAAYNNSDRSPWTVGGELAGWVTRVDNFTRVIVRSAGHDVPRDQPEWALEMIRDFVHDQSTAD
ncbi:hypothetical protein BaRGS_00005800 [Batillaria attramentaria]|uniref:Carboxypeptidase n=1 Tax=Batillaria attramentaria TaxID=370345 RepID=A0ABD0LUD4_9CAEN